MTDITTMLFTAFLLSGLLFWIKDNYEWVSDKTFSPIKPEHKMLFGDSVYPKGGFAPSLTAFFPAIKNFFIKWFWLVKRYGALGRVPAFLKRK